MLHLLAGSQAAKGTIANRHEVERNLKATPRRVWPLAKVARWFGISPSLLRKWAKQGLLPLFKRPSEHHRPGVTGHAIRTFLAELVSATESGMEVYCHRARPAEKRCHEAMRSLKPGEALAPAEFAARARVAVTTVRRLLAMGELRAWYPTPHRPKICDWMEIERRKRLTGKSGKKGG